MKAIMKTMKRNIMMIVMAAALALPAVAVEFGNTSQYAVAPQASFQSTSTMAGSGSAYTSNPTIGDDGTADYGGSSGPNRRKGKKDENPFGDQTIGDVGNPNEPGTPIGDAVLPLILMALAFCGVVYLRRKKALSR